MSFGDAAELDKELQKRVPYKIDIGAVYNYKVYILNLKYCWIALWLKLILFFKFLSVILWSF